MDLSPKITLNPNEWKILYSLGAANRYISTPELQQKQCLMETMKMNRLGLVLLESVDDGKKGVKIAHYGLSEEGFEFLMENRKCKPEKLGDYLFGAEKIPIDEARAIERQTLERISKQPGAITLPPRPTPAQQSLPAEEKLRMPGQ
jgi:hypothetical protein